MDGFPLMEIKGHLRVFLKIIIKYRFFTTVLKYEKQFP